MKPFYYLCDFPDRKNAGKNFVTECPKCGKKHLYISKETGAFHCFYGGCDFKGKLKDFWEERNNYDSTSAGKSLHSTRREGENRNRKDHIRGTHDSRRLQKADARSILQNKTTDR